MIIKNLIIDEPSQSLDLQDVGLMGSKLVDETVCCFIVSVRWNKQTQRTFILFFLERYIEDKRKKTCSVLEGILCVLFELAEETDFKLVPYEQQLKHKKACKF